MSATPPLKVFIVYAHEDKPVRDKLLRQLRPLADNGDIDLWSDHEIQAGSVWDEAIRQRLGESDLIIMLVSDDFFASDYIRNFELREALARHGRGEVRLLPVIVRHCGWEDVPAIASLQVLPTAGRPVISKEWDSPDEPYREVFRGVKAALREMREMRGMSQPADRTEPKPVLMEMPGQRSAEPLAVVTKVVMVSTAPVRPLLRSIGIGAAVLAILVLGIWGGLKMLKGDQRAQKQGVENDLGNAPNNANSPNSGIQPADNKARILPEDLAWKAVVREGTIGAYQKFLRNHPSGQHFAEASKALGQLQEDFDVNIKNAEAALKAGNRVRAKFFLDKAENLAPGSSKVQELKKKL